MNHDKFVNLPQEEVIAYLKKTIEKLESGQFVMEGCSLDIATPEQRMLGPDARYGFSPVLNRTVRWDMTIYEVLD